MKDQLKYRGLTGTVEFSQPDGVYHGKLLGINGFFSYEGEDLAALTQDFRASVDEFLEYCEQTGREPLTANGVYLSLLIQPELHEKAQTAARTEGLSVDAIVNQSLQFYLEQSQAS